MVKTDELVKSKTLARELGVTKSALAKWRLAGIGPPFLKLSPKMVRYRRSDVEAWKAAHQHTGATASHDQGSAAS